MSQLQRIYRTFDLTLKTITPLHIGTGNELEKDIDYMADGGRTHRLDIDRILTDLWDDRLDPAQAKPAQLVSGRPAAERERYYLYSAQGTVRAQQTASKLRECIKTPDQQPYIPGSSLKGALRTALAWAGWQAAIQGPLRADDLGRQKSWAGQGLEDKLFRPARQGGDGPNKDLMRAFQVGDLHLTDPGRGLQILNVQVAKNREFASPIEAEAVGAEAAFRGQLHLDDHVFSAAAARLGLAERKAWLDEVAKRVNAHTLYRLDLLLARLEQMHHAGIDRLIQMVRGWKQLLATFGPNECVLCLGWGGGWDSKTFGSRLQQDARFFEAQVIERYRLHRGRAERKAGDPFPRTRRLAVRQTPNGPQVNGLPGWCYLTITPRPLP